MGDITRYLFVYGTLKRRFDNTEAIFLRQNAIYIAEGWMYGRMYYVDWYPGAVKIDNTSSKIYGEIYELSDPDQVFERIDRYEDAGDLKHNKNLYIREIIDIYSHDKTYKCWVYIYIKPTNGLTCIDSGIF